MSPITLYCPKCGYNLSMLLENTCPECGTAFDPQSLRARQGEVASTRSVVLQLVFVPILFAVLAPFCVIGGISGRSVGAVGQAVGVFVALGILLCVIGLHALYLSRVYTSSRKVRDGEDNVPWLFRHVWACCLLFTLVEAGVTFAYFAGGCAVILMNIKIH